MADTILTNRLAFFDSTPIMKHLPTGLRLCENLLLHSHLDEAPANWYSCPSVVREFHAQSPRQSQLERGLLVHSRWSKTKPNPGPQSALFLRVVEAKTPAAVRELRAKSFALSSVVRNSSSTPISMTIDNFQVRTTEPVFLSRGSPKQATVTRRLTSYNVELV